MKTTLMMIFCLSTLGTTNTFAQKIDPNYYNSPDARKMMSAEGYVADQIKSQCEGLAPYAKDPRWTNQDIYDCYKKYMLNSTFMALATSLNNCPKTGDLKCLQAQVGQISAMDHSVDTCETQLAQAQDKLAQSNPSVSKSKSAAAHQVSPTTTSIPLPASAGGKAAQPVLVTAPPRQ